MEALSYNLTYTENFNQTTILFGSISQPKVIAFNRSIYDTTTCSSFTELIVTEKSHPYVIGTQMRLNADQEIASIDSIITDADDWFFNATAYALYSSSEDWSPIPTAQQDSRATIQAAASAYLDIFSNASAVVPWGSPCARLEGGGMYTGRGLSNDTCNIGVPEAHNISLVNRRFVVDEELGAVDVFMNVGGDKGFPDSHLFRVEAGRIRFVHTLSVTAGRGLRAARRWR